MTTKHTPGPWAIGEMDGEAYGINATVNGHPVYIAETIGGLGAETDKANALLIAAAPDLLAALRAVYEDPDSGIAWTLVRAAMSKVDGT